MRGRKFFKYIYLGNFRLTLTNLTEGQVERGERGKTRFRDAGFELGPAATPEALRAYGTTATCVAQCTVRLRHRRGGCT